MAKRNNRIDTEVIALAVTGLSQRAIAKKLAISKTTVSKILQEAKNDQKLTKAQAVVQNGTDLERKSNRKKAHETIDLIMDGLQKDLAKASVKDKRELLKTLVELFGMPDEQEEDVTKIEIEIEDASGDTED
jgi:predicted transcriptional regulator